jgi:hypothetical protein
MYNSEEIEVGLPEVVTLQSIHMEVELEFKSLRSSKFPVFPPQTPPHNL